jgi:hypothetical protein
LTALAVALALLAPSLHVRPAVAAPGARVVVSGNAGGCPRGDTVTVISRAFAGPGFAGIGGGGGPVRADGTFSVRLRIARGAANGRYVVTARCGGGNLGVRAFVRVRA